MRSVTARGGNARHTQPPAPGHAWWLNGNPVRRLDMAFSHGGLRNPQDIAAHGDWAARNRKALGPFSSGIQLADENLTGRPARFRSDANLTRMDTIRAHYDPQRRFPVWRIG